LQRYRHANTHTYRHINSTRNFTNGTSQTSHGVILRSRPHRRHRGGYMCPAAAAASARVEGGNRRPSEVSAAEIDLRHEPVPELGVPPPPRTGSYPDSRPTASRLHTAQRPVAQRPFYMSAVHDRRCGRTRGAASRTVAEPRDGTVGDEQTADSTRSGVRGAVVKSGPIKKAADTRGLVPGSRTAYSFLMQLLLQSTSPRIQVVELRIGHHFWAFVVGGAGCSCWL
jgi:hypothetical protein